MVELPKTSVPVVTEWVDVVTSLPLRIRNVIVVSVEVALPNMSVPEPEVETLNESPSLYSFLFTRYV